MKLEIACRTFVSVHFGVPRGQLVETLRSCLQEVRRRNMGTAGYVAAEIKQEEERTEMCTHKAYLSEQVTRGGDQPSVK